MDLIKLQQIKVEFDELNLEIEKLQQSINLSGLKKQLDQLEVKTTASNFWEDAQGAKQVFKQISLIKNKIKGLEEVLILKQDCETLFELVEVENDDEAFEELKLSVQNLKQTLSRQLMEILLSGPYDSSSAILTLHAGAGGVESMDWV